MTQAKIQDQGRIPTPDPSLATTLARLSLSSVRLGRWPTSNHPSVRWLRSMVYLYPLSARTA